MTRRILLAAIGPAVGVLMAIAGGAGPAAAQGAGSVTAVERCDLFRELGRTLPPECRGMAAPSDSGGVQTRGRIIIGRPSAPPPAAGRPAAATPATPAAPGAAMPAAPATPGMPPPRAMPQRTVGLLIPFALGSAELSADARALLDVVAEVIKSNSGDRFAIEGHTDARGSDAFNQALSERRAASAIAYLVQQHGIERSRLEAQGYGESRPIIPADPLDARNRRVQVSNLGG